MILAKTRYKAYNNQVLAIIKVFKTWNHYLKGYKHKVLAFINYHKLQQFIYTKSLSFCYVRWA